MRCRSECWLEPLILEHCDVLGNCTKAYSKLLNSTVETQKNIMSLSSKKSSTNGVAKPN